MYSINGDTRSRTGGELSFDGFVFDWLSKLQNCRGTEYKEGFDVAQSSCEAEVYGAADLTKIVRQYSFVAEELKSFSWALGRSRPGPTAKHLSAI